MENGDFSMTPWIISKRRQVTQAAEYWQALQDIDGFWVPESSADEFYRLFRCIWVDYNDLTATSL